MVTSESPVSPMNLLIFSVLKLLLTSAKVVSAAAEKSGTKVSL
jgi:hypothetical protein